MKGKVLGLVALIVFLCSGVSRAEDPIKIGILFPLSGPLGLVGVEYIENWDIVADMINDRGGIKGRKVMGVKADAVDPKTAMAETERLATVENVNCIIGTYSSPRAQVASEVAEKYKKIYFETGAAADSLTERGLKYFFRVQVKGSEYGKTGATFIAKTLAPAIKKSAKDLKVVVCYEDSIWGGTINKAFMEQAKAEGLNVLDSTSYNYKAVDFSAMITKFKSLSPDVVFAANYPNDFMILWRQMKQLDFNMKAYVGTGTLIHDSLPEALGSDIDYVFDIQGVGIQNFNLDYISQEARAFLDEVKDRYKKKYGKEMPPSHWGSAWEMWLFVSKVLVKAGSDDPEAVRKVLLELDVPRKDSLIGYGVKFAGPDSSEAGQNIHAVPGIMQWQKKKLWTVYPPELATSEMWPIMPTWKEREQK